MGQEGRAHDGSEGGPVHTYRWQVSLEERQLSGVQNKQAGWDLIPDECVSLPFATLKPDDLCLFP